MLDLAIVILNFNTCDYLRRCLTSVYASQGDFTFDVCVVDNASPDNSVDMVRAEFPQARVIQSPENVGFACGNNLGLRAYGFGQETTQAAESQPRYALLLNPDTKLPPDALAKMLDFMSSHPRAGAAGPKLILEDGSLDLACRRGFPTPQVAFYHMVRLSKLFPHSPTFARYNLTFLNPNLVAEVDSVVGAFMLMRREAIREVGLLDQEFFMYGEDLDWAYRGSQIGWKVYYNPDVTVLHVKRAASRHSPRAQREFYRAMLIFYNKHYAHSTSPWLHWLVVAGINLQAGLLRCQQALAGGDDGQPGNNLARSG